MVADINPTDTAAGNPPLQQNYLYWIIDAYTTSDRYPYSEPGKDEFNYIRNSIKVVIDTYNGSVDFYVADLEDPIITTLAAVFPGMFKQLETMPVALRSHLRYPVDLFNIQSERFLTYHMTDVQFFITGKTCGKFPTRFMAANRERWSRTI